MEKEDFVASQSGISPLGLLVRQAYCVNMRRVRGKRKYGLYIIPQYDGGTSESGRQYKKNIWDKIAAILCKNEIDAGEYIEHVFNTRLDVESPNILLSNVVIERFKQIIMGAERPSIWEFEENKLLTEITVKSVTISDPVEVLKIVLLDDNIYVSPLVRYSFGHNKGMDFIVDVLEKRALNQYMRRRFFYERYYKDNIPENLRKKVKDGEPKAEFE